MSGFDKILDEIASLERRKWEIIFLNILPQCNSEKINPALFQRIDDLDIMVRTCRALQAENIHLIGDIVCNPFLEANPSHYYNKKDFIALTRAPNFGKKSHNDLIFALSKKGFDKYINIPEYLVLRFEKTGIQYEFRKI